VPTCPRCCSTFYNGAEACPHCNFSLSQCSKLFSQPLRQLGRINDLAGILEQRQRQSIIKHFSKLERKLAPLHYALVTTNLEAANLLQQYAFWLLNNAEINPGSFDCSSVDAHWMILLVVDVRNHQFSFSYGYQVERYIAQDEIYSCMHAAGENFAASEWSKGIIACSGLLNNSILRQFKHQH